MTDLTPEQRAFRIMQTWQSEDIGRPIEAAIAAAIRDADRAQMERDCAAVCVYCAHIGENWEGDISQEPVKRLDGKWFHPTSDGIDTFNAFCWAGAIRDAAIERAVPPPAPQAGRR